MNTITPRQLQELLIEQPDLPVIDVRTPVEFAEVHLRQARNLPLDELQPRTLVDPGTLFGNKNVYLLCRSGSRARKAAEKFAKAGIAQTIVVEGGILAWVEAGLPIIHGKSKGISLERQVRIAAGSLVFLGAILGWLVHPGFFGISGFVGAGLIFAGITDFCGMGLLLARAPWNKRIT